ncbi:MAG: squalene synthase HpnC, partial [Chloroflexi bacterium]|nr:squalene synthase HpnC [Chloroflexota bacterium]
VLDAIERQDYDVLTSRPEVSKAAKVRLMLRTMLKLGLLRRV